MVKNFKGVLWGFQGFERFKVSHGKIQRFSGAQGLRFRFRVQEFRDEGFRGSRFGVEGFELGVRVHGPRSTVTKVSGS